VILTFNLPDDRHIFRMTDATGMLQHAKYSVPNPNFGYTADDNARALIMAAMLWEASAQPKYLELLYRYLSFLLYARQGSWFRNVMDFDRHFAEERGSEDCFGRCIWALGYIVSRPSLPRDCQLTARELLQEVLPGCGELNHLRAKSYALIGLLHWQSAPALATAAVLAGDLIRQYAARSEPGWEWFEDHVTYCNAVIPWALLDYYAHSQEEKALAAAVSSLDFLFAHTCKNGVFYPIGCHGWLKPGTPAALHDQQPVEACESLLASLKAYQLTGEKRYQHCARQCFRWYTGQNSRQTGLISPASGGCMDGITAAGLNGNQGAESLISWIISALVWEKHLNEASSPEKRNRIPGSITPALAPGQITV
jgi:hypothetical protein